jgi:2'-5' RNA ligase
MKSARLFAAVSFTTAEKEALAALSRELRQHCRGGRFPEPALLHITLYFFGQTELNRLPSIEAALRQAAAGTRPFALSTGHAGCFGRRDSAVLWLGLQRGAAELTALQASLVAALSEQGFAPEGRAFRPHITIGRDVSFDGKVEELDLPGVALQVKGITLMESTQAGGKLNYLPLFQAVFD